MPRPVAVSPVPQPGSLGTAHGPSAAGTGHPLDLTNLPKPASLGTPHGGGVANGGNPTTIGNLPRPSVAGSRLDLAHLPRPNSIGNSMLHQPQAGTRRPLDVAHLPVPNSIGANASTTGNRVLQHAKTLSATPKNTHSLLGDVATVGVGIATGGVAGAVTAVVGAKNTIGDISKPLGTTPGPAEKTSMVTSDKSGFTDASKGVPTQVSKGPIKLTGKAVVPSLVPKAELAVMAAKASEAAKSAQVAKQNALRNPLDLKAQMAAQTASQKAIAAQAQFAVASANNAKATAANAANNTQPAANAPAKQPQITCIVAPCPTHFPTSSAQKDPAQLPPTPATTDASAPSTPVGAGSPVTNMPVPVVVDTSVPAVGDVPPVAVVVPAPVVVDTSIPVVSDVPPVAIVAAPIVPAPVVTAPVVAQTPVVSAPALRPTQAKQAAPSTPQAAPPSAQIAALPPNPSATAQPPGTPQPGPAFVAVTFQANTTNEDIEAFLKAYDVSIFDGPDADGLVKLQLSSPLPADQLQQVIDSMKSQTNIVLSAVVDDGGKPPQ